MVIFRKDFLILAGFYIWEVIFLLRKQSEIYVEKNYYYIRNSYY